MLDADGEILYVGKARHLRNRVSSYFHGRVARRQDAWRCSAQVARVEVTVTASETEALLLEFNLIKQHRPRYNVLLKDDKSFPFIHVSGHAYPRIAFYRGTKQAARPVLRPVSRTRSRRARRCCCCRSCSACAPARTRSSRTARGPACSTRSIAAAGPASAWSRRSSTRGRGRRGQGARRPQRRGHRGPRSAHGGGRGEARVRAGGAAARPDPDAEADPGDAGR